MAFLDEIGSTEVPPADERRRRGRRLWLVLLMLLVLAAAAYVALHRYAEDRVPLGRSVEGVDLGGLDATAAAARLRADLAPRLRQPVVFTHEDHRYLFDAAGAGMRLDVPGTLGAVGVGTPRWTPASLWRFLTAAHDVHAVVAVDQQRFTDALDALTARIGQPLVEGDVRFVDGRPQAVIGQAGLTVDHDRTQALVEQLAFAGHPGELPLTIRQPYVAPAAVRAALRDIARPAMAAPVVVELGRHRVSVPPAVLGQVLDLVPSSGRLTLLVDADHLADLVVARSRTLGPKPVDATVRLEAGRPVVVPAVDGVSFDHQQLADALPAVLRRPAGHRVVAVHAVLQHARRTTADVRGWRIDRRLGSITLADPAGPAAALDGIVVPPGGSLHLAARVPGADASLATALFTLALHAGVPVTGSVPRSYDATLPAGLQRTDVTITAPADTGLLLTLTGARPGPQLTLWGAGHAHVRVVVGHRRGVVPPPVRTSNAADCTPRAGVAGFSVTVRRQVRGHAPERFVSRYAPVPAVTCEPPSASASPDPALSPLPSGAPR